MDLIDTHQHLILRGEIGYDWTHNHPPLAKNSFTLDDYAQLTLGKGVIGTLFMEAGVNDADYQAEARLIAPMIGSFDLRGQIASCRPEFDQGFDEWLSLAPSLGIKGYRRILHELPDDLSQSEPFRRNLRKIGKAGLPFDLCVLARQLPLAIDLIRTCPDQQFILDHCGVPDIAGDGYVDWAGPLRQVSKLPNVICKLSGISAYCAPNDATVATMRPYVNHLLECFGPARMIWGSDWPVVNLRSQLGDWIDHTRVLLKHLSGAEQAAIGHQNAQTIYRI
jgi:predicted TIM-barrel fold metal-dependent hydrolase